MQSSGDTTEDEKQRSIKTIQNRWKEARFIHAHLRNHSERVGSIESALARAQSDRWVKKNMFIHGIVSEYRCNSSRRTPVGIDAHLGRFYDTFPGADKSEVDWRTILCTFLCLMYAEVAFVDPMSLLLQFFGIYADVDTGDVRIGDMLSIASIGSTTFGDAANNLADCLALLSNDGTSRPPLVSQDMLKDALEMCPSVLLTFRGDIIQQLPEDRRLELLAKEEEKAAMGAARQTDKIMMQHAMKFRRRSLLKSFEVWLGLTRRKLQHQRSLLMISCLKAKRSMREWKRRSQAAILWREQQALASALYVKSKLRICFDMWVRVVRTFKRIRASCEMISDRFKQRRVALGLLRCAWERCTMRLMFNQWRLSEQLEQKLEVSITWYKVRMIHRVVGAWKKVTKEANSRRVHERESKDQQAWLARIIDEMEADADRIRAQVPLPPAPMESELARRREDARERKNMFDALGDRSVVLGQRSLRRKRVADEKVALIKEWNIRWEKKGIEACKACVSRTNTWMATAESKSVLLKLEKQLHNNIFEQPPSVGDEREKVLLSNACSSLAIVDGKIAHASALPDLLFERIQETMTSDRFIEFDVFADSLKYLQVDVDPAIIRSLFDELSESDGDSEFHYDRLMTAWKAADEHMGGAGMQWKYYVSAAQEMMVLHDTFTDIKILEHDVSKKKLRAIVRDNYRSSELLQERRRLAETRASDYIFIMSNYAAKALQRMYRCRMQRNRKQVWMVNRMVDKQRSQAATIIQSMLRTFLALRRVRFRLNLESATRLQQTS